MYTVDKIEINKENPEMIKGGYGLETLLSIVDAYSGGGGGSSLETNNYSRFADLSVPLGLVTKIYPSKILPRHYYVGGEDKIEPIENRIFTELESLIFKQNGGKKTRKNKNKTKQSSTKKHIKTI